MSTHRDRPIVFVDFDGTIARSDVVDAILERHADPRWLAFEREWQAGRLGSRDCLREQMALVRATSAEIDVLLAEIDIDPGLVPLIESAAQHEIPLHIVSDGFDYCIARILARLPGRVAPLVTSMQVCASHLEPDERRAAARWRASFPFYSEPCEHGCATCKPTVMQAINAVGARTIFVGDGLSDRYAAAVADVVFAKDRLATYCVDSGIPHIQYSDLSDVAAFLDVSQRGVRLSRRQHDDRTDRFTASDPHLGRA
jgi:2-hydroxy-3-keto-5-methylthiopentenyl-1-phosphate phosphatase